MRWLVTAVARVTEREMSMTYEVKCEFCGTPWMLSHGRRGIASAVGSGRGSLEVLTSRLRRRTGKGFAHPIAYAGSRRGCRRSARPLTF